VKARPQATGDRRGETLLLLFLDAPIQTKLIVCSERSEPRLDSGVLVMSVRRFLEALWNDAIVTPGVDGGES
jgi:hypothetical protein